jgi:Zn-finger nucleic acid-binding protein
MKCPHCEFDLVLADRQDVEIYFCQKCRGIWLDRGALEKIFERFSDPQRRENHSPRENQDKNTGNSNMTPRTRHISPPASDLVTMSRKENHSETKCE